MIIFTVSGEEMDKVRGLELGADDYIVKPFSHRELAGKDKNSDAAGTGLRPWMGHPASAPASAMIIDFSTDTVTRDDKPVKLTAPNLTCLNTLPLMTEGFLVTRISW